MERHFKNFLSETKKDLKVGFRENYIRNLVAIQGGSFLALLSGVESIRDNQTLGSIGLAVSIALYSLVTADSITIGREMRRKRNMNEQL